MWGRVKIKGSAVALLTALALVSCSRQIPEPVSPPKDEPVPPTPTNLTARVGDHFVVLSWSVSDTSTISFYRVYTADSTASDYSLLAEVNQTTYTASDLANGAVHYFKVSSVNRSRFEGYLSSAVMAVPNLYQIIINDGDSHTNSRSVTLRLVAPIGTQYVQISDDSSFIDAPWENYASPRSWLLPLGDGPATVYSRFRDLSDHITAGYYSDAITLDTQAFIDSVTFSPAGHPFSVGDQVHFKVFAVEPEGQASIMVGQNLISANLYDDGTRGDAVANDGVYETNYIINGSSDFENAAVFGDFTDIAGNSAQQARALNDISVRRAPDAVSIYSIAGVNGRYDRLQIDWTRSTAGDFAQYRIYRSQSAGVDSTDYLAGTITSSATNSLLDTGLAANTVFYYKVYVLDNTGLWTGSNEESGSTFPNQPPQPVTLFPVVTVPGTHDRLSLSWSVCNDQDFLRYELYRSYASNVDTSDILLLATASQTAFVDSNLAADSVYYYGVLALDRAGGRSWSNVESGRTGVDEPPGPAELNPVIVEPDFYQSVALSWSHTDIDDFEAFRIYSWREDAGRNDSLLIAIISDQATTTFTDSPSFDIPGDTLALWYVIHTYDEGGNSAASNALRVELIDLAPGQVTGAVIPESTEMAVSWMASEIPDFSNYSLLRDTLSSPAQARVIFMTPDRETTSYRDANLVRGLTYYYWLEIYDRRNHDSRSFLGSSRW